MQVHLVYLPTYSPELNPCELVFGLVKRWMRHNAGRGSFLTELSLAFTQSVSIDAVRNAYHHCLETCFA